jgi:hypothetical protein
MAEIDTGAGEENRTLVNITNAVGSRGFSFSVRKGDFRTNYQGGTVGVFRK